MLILDRYPGQGIVINDSIEIQFKLNPRPNQVDLMIRAPRHIPVYRAELYERIKKGLKKKITYKRSRKQLKEIESNDGT